MPKTTETPNKETTDVTPNRSKREIDSKYRLIILAAQRSKQLVRGARPRVDMDLQKHKPTRIALEEMQRGEVGYEIIDSD